MHSVDKQAKDKWKARCPSDSGVTPGKSKYSKDRTGRENHRKSTAKAETRGSQANHLSAQVRQTIRGARVRCRGLLFPVEKQRTLVSLSRCVDMLIVAVPAGTMDRKKRYCTGH